MIVCGGVPGSSWVVATAVWRHWAFIMRLRDGPTKRKEMGCLSGIFLVIALPIAHSYQAIVMQTIPFFDGLASAQSGMKIYPRC